MQTIILIMLRQPVAQRLFQKLHNDSGTRVILESDYHKAISVVEAHDAYTVLIEVTESGEYDAAFCLDLCKRIQSNSPQCRRLLLCPEQDELSVLTAVEAVRDGRINDFLFYDVSIDYLASKLLSV